MIYKIKLSDGNKNDLINYILKKKDLGKFNVIDVGGSLGGWSSPYIDAVIDFNDLSVNNVTYKNIKHFKCDITHPDSWNNILNYVEINGKFDFCICTHTLEDIINPVYVTEQICKISTEGYISFPSKFRELSRFEGNKNYHQYVFFKT